MNVWGGEMVITYAWNEMKGEKGAPSSLSLFGEKDVENAYQFQRTHVQYEKTPLITLKHLSNALGIDNVFIKDESHRFGLNAFKALGGLYVVGRYLAEHLGSKVSDLTIAKLAKAEIEEITFASATDGNHGRAIAWAAQELNHHAVIYLPKGSALERVQAIEREGGHAVVTDKNYDDTVRMITKDAKENGWVLVQDTAWEGYEKIPLWIMQGYATLMREINEQLKTTKPTHIFLQAGVGSYAAAVVASCVQLYEKNRPVFILVEPNEANCYYKSFLANDHNFRTVDGDLDTVMAGLSCGEPSPVAWKILKEYVDISFSCADAVSALGMRVLGSPLGNDQRVISGEAGAVTTGLLYALMTDSTYEHIRDRLQLDRDANVVLINTEGDTDQAHYRQVVWEGAHPFKS